MKTRILHSFVIALLSLSCLTAFTLGALSVAHADKTNLSTMGSKKKSSGVTLMLGKADIVSIGGEAADVLVANPGIVDVMAVKSDKLYLVGSALGDTNVMVLDANGNVIKKVNVHVQMDTDRLEDMISDLYPNEAVQVRALTDQVVLTGEVSTPAIANKISNLVGRYASDAQGLARSESDSVIMNMMSVRGEQQVMLKVKIVEASRSAVKNLGLNLESLNAGRSNGLNGTLNSSGGLGLSAPQQLATALLNYSSGTFGNLSLVAQALEQEGIINTLAEPNLTAISGEQAGFLAGGEFPIPTQIDRNGNLIYEFKPFGVSLNFKPHVMSENRISLQLTTEVSTTSFEQNLQLNGINVPTFNVRRAETNVELPSGGTLMIAGLIKSDSISGLSQLPGIGDVPVMGDLIKSDSFQRSESEVLVMITPYLVKPFAQNQTASAPVMAPQGPAVTHVGPEVNYGAIVPEDTNLPEPARQKSKETSFFSDNMRRVYGADAPENLLSGGSDFGYVLD